MVAPAGDDRHDDYLFIGAMRAVVRRKLTITVEVEVYDGLYKVVGRRRISRFLNELARPHVVRDDLEANYRAMVADEEHERQAMEWIEGVVADEAG